MMITEKFNNTQHIYTFPTFKKIIYIFPSIPKDRDQLYIYTTNEAFLTGFPAYNRIYLKSIRNCSIHAIKDEPS